ncbi:hypothetical protein DM39_1932 [Burkholderia cenocepacia]|uniref:Uncharacterized protein n=1 Tax=Burkholderia cenocepacia TaxID=95486 RepID=A0AAN0RRV1_9BURK|nr:hypothetical protein DM39_1932 [Burkholderia cenocepacia]
MVVRRAGRRCDSRTAPPPSSNGTKTGRGVHVAADAGRGNACANAAVNAAVRHSTSQKPALVSDHDTLASDGNDTLVRAPDAIPYASHAAGSGNRLRVVGKTRPVRTSFGHRDGAVAEACRRATPCVERTASAIMRRHATTGHAPRRTLAIDIKKPAQAARVSANRCVTPAIQAVNACSASSVSHSDVCRSCSFRFSPSPPRSTTMKSLTSPSAISG